LIVGVDARDEGLDLIRIPFPILFIPLFEFDRIFVCFESISAPCFS
jgi:hypothetical protein